MERQLEKIDFYILSNEDYTSFACRLLEKAYQENLRVFVLCVSETKARELNDLLWTFKDISFVPHHLANDPKGSGPICIHHLAPTSDEAVHYDILLNLSLQLPESFNAFSRLMSVVPEEETCKQYARAHYKQLTDLGYTIHTHKMG